MIHSEKLFAQSVNSKFPFARDNNYNLQIEHVNLKTQMANLTIFLDVRGIEYC